MEGIPFNCCILFHCIILLTLFTHTLIERLLKLLIGFFFFFATAENAVVNISVRVALCAFKEK